MKMLNKSTVLKIAGVMAIGFALVGCKSATEREYREDVAQAFGVANNVSMDMLRALEQRRNSCTDGNFGYDNVVSCKIDGDKGSVEIGKLKNTKMKLKVEITAGSRDMTCTLSDKKAADLFNTNDCLTMFRDNTRDLRNLD